LFAACSSPATEVEATTTPTENNSLTSDDVEGQQLAYFAGGCFWGVEHFMEQIPGVYGVESGYMGGHVDNPSYEQVSSQTSGHYETVRVRYDAAKLTYHDLAKRFFEIHDPTQADGQGPDIGPEYLSVVFYASEDEKRATENLISRLVERGYDVATELEPTQTFWLAEEYHQDYYVRANKKPYCHTPVDRFGDS
jgi:peptide methionine sulfoxide reductase msrA/msrB